MKRRTLSLLVVGAALLLARPPRQVPYDDLAVELDATVGGERRAYNWRLGRIAYRVAGNGEPLVLVHGINAVASSYEMRRNLAGLAQDFRVYVPDLLGFGLSDRPRIPYTADIYEEALADFLRDVVGGPAHVVASSSSGAHAVAVAHAHPDLVRTLVLICPTGIERLSGPPTVGQRVAEVLIGAPVLGSRIFSGLVARPSVRYALRSMVYYSPEHVTPEMVQMLHRLGQRPGTRWAPRAFVGGQLNRNIADQFAAARQPILLAWGKQARIVPLADAPAFLERNPRATLKVFDRAELAPHDEQAEAFNAVVREWVKEHSR